MHELHDHEPNLLISEYLEGEGRLRQDMGDDLGTFSAMNLEPDRPEADIMQEYADAWDYLYEPSRYLARAYSCYLAMRPASWAQAAAAGGFTTVLDMPNTRPPTTNSARLAAKISTVQGRLYANVSFQAALTTDSSELKRMTEQGAIAFKLYLNKSLETFDTSDSTSLTTALRAAQENDALVTIHAEDGDMIRRVQNESLAHGRTSVNDFLNAHPPQAEAIALRRILGLGKQIGVRLHICHITLADSVKLIRATSNATCEATAHHLLLNRAAFRKFGTQAICVPPIRAEPYRRSLWKAFTAGEVDILASDHAPHTMDEKTQKNAWQAASGVPGLETSLPVLFTQVTRGKLSLRRLVQATAALPAKIFRLTSKGILKEGYDADITLIDPKARSIVDPKNFLSKARYTPFKGMKCIGRATHTVVNGTLVAEHGKIVGPPAGAITRAT
jgi:dihydroorotase (multifunctional complex type)